MALSTFYHKRPPQLRNTKLVIGVCLDNHHANQLSPGCQRSCADFHVIGVAQFLSRPPKCSALSFCWQLQPDIDDESSSDVTTKQIKRSLQSCRRQSSCKTSSLETSPQKSSWSNHRVSVQYKLKVEIHSSSEGDQTTLSWDKSDGKKIKLSTAAK